MIWDLAKIECVIWEYKINPAMIQKYYINCDTGFALPVVCDFLFPPTKFHKKKLNMVWLL